MMNSGTVLPFFQMRRRLCDNLIEKGYEITVSGYTEVSKDLLKQYKADYVYIPLSRAGINPVQDLKVLRAYYKEMKREKYEIVHSYTAKPNIYGSIAAKYAGIRRIYPTVNGLGYAFTDVDTGKLKAKFVRFMISLLYKWGFSCATKVFFQNKDDARELIRRKIIDKGKCVLISGSGIELDAYPYSECSVTPMVFLIATRLLVTKGVREFCEAARIVKRKYSEAVFQLAGALDDNPDSISQKELNFYVKEGIIQYLGVVRDMPSALKKCSVFVLPSFYREGIPHVILEAMSVGRAVITTDSPGCKETVRGADEMGKGKNGFLIPAKDSQILAEKMIWMIEHTDRVKEMGEESRRYAEERFDVEMVNKVMLETMGL